MTNLQLSIVLENRHSIRLFAWGTTTSMVRVYSLKIKTCGINIRQPVSYLSAKVVDEQFFAVWMVVTINVVKTIFLDLEIGCDNICPQGIITIEHY